MSNIRSLKVLIRREFQDVWSEYFVAEYERCSASIASLSTQGAAEKNFPNTFATSYPFPPAPDTIPTATGTGSIDSSTFTIYDYEYGQSPPPSTFKAEVARLHAIAPAPDYEATSPLYSCVTKGDDPDDLPFLPFATSSDLKAAHFMDLHGGLAWQEDINDIESKS